MMEFVNGKDDIPYMENNPFMFETTNQMRIDLAKVCTGIIESNPNVSYIRNMHAISCNI